MTDKEKAIAYDKAIERARKLYGNEITEEIFSELKESDDEKMRNFIINELACLRATDEKGSDRYEELTNAITWLENQGKEEYALKSFKYEDVRKFMQYIEKQAKAYEFNLPNRSYDIYAFAKDILVWLEKQDKNYTDKIEPKFKVGDWTVNKFSDSWHIDSFDEKNYQVSDEKGNYNYFPISKQDEMRSWNIQDAKDGDVLSFYSDYKGKKMFQIGIVEKYVGKLGGCYNTFKTYVGIDWDNNLHIGRYMGCDDIYPATKEQCDALIKVMNDAEYEWDIEKKELKKKRKR